MIDFLISWFLVGGNDDESTRPSWLERRTPWGRVKAWAYRRYADNLLAADAQQPSE